MGGRLSRPHFYSPHWIFRPSYGPKSNICTYSSGGAGGERGEEIASGGKERKKNEKNDDDAYLQNEGRLLAFFKKCVMCLFFSTSSQIVRVRYANLGECSAAAAVGPSRAAVYLSPLSLQVHLSTLKLRRSFV